MVRGTIYCFWSFVETPVVASISAKLSSYYEVGPPLVLNLLKLTLEGTTCQAEGCFFYTGRTVGPGVPCVLISSKLLSLNQSLFFFVVNPRVSSDVCRTTVLIWSHSTSGARGESARQMGSSSLDHKLSWKTALTAPD